MNWSVTISEPEDGHKLGSNFLLLSQYCLPNESTLSLLKKSSLRLDEILVFDHLILRNLRFPRETFRLCVIRSAVTPIGLWKEVAESENLKTWSVVYCSLCYFIQV